MKRVFVLASLLAVMVIASSARVNANEDKDFDIGEFMKKAHGKEGFRTEINKAVKGKDWDAASKTAKTWAEDAEKMLKAKPPKGEAKSWEKMAGSYAKTVKALAEATEGKDAKKTAASLKTIAGSCGGCHKAHKP